MSETTRSLVPVFPAYSPDINPIDQAFAKIKRTCARPRPQRSTRSGERSVRSATCSNHKSAGTTLRLPDMRPFNRPMSSKEVRSRNVYSQADMLS